MAGSWELKRQNSVLCAILHTDYTSIAWAFGLRNLIIPGHIMGLAGMPFDMARNAACEHMLRGGYDWLFFLDSDVIPPNDAVVRLMAHNQPFISGMYCRRSPPASVPVAIKDGAWCTIPPDSGVIEVDLVGAGCLLIHRSFLERIPPQRPEAGKTWFDWRVDCRGAKRADGTMFQEGECLSEDFTLCTWARRHGYKVLLDTSVHCKHVGFCQSTYGQLNPLEANPVT